MPTCSTSRSDPFAVVPAGFQRLREVHAFDVLLRRSSHLERAGSRTDVREMQRCGPHRRVARVPRFQIAIQRDHGFVFPQRDGRGVERRLAVECNRHQNRQQKGAFHRHILLQFRWCRSRGGCSIPALRCLHGSTIPCFPGRCCRSSRHRRSRGRRADQARAASRLQRRQDRLQLPRRHLGRQRGRHRRASRDRSHRARHLSALLAGRQVDRLLVESLRQQRRLRDSRRGRRREAADVPQRQR